MRFFPAPIQLRVRSADQRRSNRVVQVRFGRTYQSLDRPRLSGLPIVQRIFGLQWELHKRKEYCYMISPFAGHPNFATAGGLLQEARYAHSMTSRPAYLCAWQPFSSNLRSGSYRRCNTQSRNLVPAGTRPDGLEIKSRPGCSVKPDALISALGG